MRQIFLIASVIIASATAFAQPAPLSAPGNPYEADMSLPSAEYRFKEVQERIAPHIYEIHPRIKYTPLPQANEMLVEQNDGLVLIDAGKTRGDGKRIVALIRKISPKPVKAIIITHWHQDHVLGLGPIVEAWPNAVVVSSAATLHDIQTDPSYETRPKKGEPTATYDKARAASLAKYAQEFGPKIRDMTLSGEERRGFADVVGVLKLRIADEQGTYLVLPTVTFTDRYTIDDPAAPVEALFVGPSHTDGDIVVWAPKQRVAASGDMIVNPIPYPGDHVLAWPDSLRNLKKLRPAIIVPGHGALLHGTAFVDRMIAAFDEMRTKAQALVNGPPLTDDQVQAKIDLSAMKKRFSGGDPWLAYWFDQYFAPNAVEAYDELRKEGAK